MKSQEGSSDIFTDFNNVPNDLYIVLEHALRILNWQELPSDETPPTWMWPLDWEIDKWFEKVKIERKRKWGSPDTGDDDSDDSGSTSMFDDGENIYFERVKRGEPLFD